MTSPPAPRSASDVAVSRRVAVTLTLPVADTDVAYEAAGSAGATAIEEDRPIRATTRVSTNDTAFPVATLTTPPPPEGILAVASLRARAATVKSPTVRVAPSSTIAETVVTFVVVPISAVGA